MRYMALFLILFAFLQMASAATYSSCAAVPASVLGGKTCRPITTTPITSVVNLNQQNSYYLFMNDISCDGSCFDITASDITVDLNEYTLTFGNAAPIVIPNFGFENGNQNWDLSGAPAASITTNIPKPLSIWVTDEVKNYALKFSQPATYQQVVSDPISLIPGKKYILSYLVHSEFNTAADVIGTVDAPIHGFVSTFCRDSSGTAGVGSMGVSAYYGPDYDDRWGAAIGNHYMSNGFACEFYVDVPNPRVVMKYRANAAARSDVYIDAIEISPTGDYGVKIGVNSYSTVTRNAKIINGKIVQGRAKTYYARAIQTYIGPSNENHEFNNLNITVWGPDSDAIFVGGNRISIHHNTLNHMVNRTHLSHEGIWAGNAIDATILTNSMIYENNIPRSSSGISIGTSSTTYASTNISIYNNRIDVFSNAIHSYALGINGRIATTPTTNVRFFNNFINTTKGCGIFLEGGSVGNFIYNNYVETRDSPQEERNWLVKALWMRFSSNNHSIYNNTFKSYGGDNLFRAGDKAGATTVRIGSYNTDFGPTYFYNNYVEVWTNYADPDSLVEPYHAGGIVATAFDIADGGALSNGTERYGLEKFVHNNVFKSNNRVVALGSNYGPSKHSYLSSNKLIKGDNPLYYTSIFLGVEGSYDSYLLNITGENGASVNDIRYWSSGPRNFNISWYLGIRAQDGSGNPLQGAAISIRDSGSILRASGSSNSQGSYLSALVERMFSGSGSSPSISTFSPYSVSVTYGGQTQTRTVTLDSSKTETFTFTSTPCTNGQTQSCTTSQSCPGTSTCSGGVWGSCVDNMGDNCPDVLPPAAITTLQATASTTSTVSLQWTSPGDDGSTGTASSYDVRYSTASINDGNFASASQATGEPAPLIAGTSQSMTIGSLSPSTTYYFAVKTSDEVPLTSALSNVISRATATGGDSTAPAAITNLLATASTSNSVSLQWTSPGDDGSTGTASSYDVRYSTASINDGNFASASQATGEPAPLIAGTSQSMTIGSLSPSTTYYFAVKTSDEVPNWSALSNAVSRATTAGADTTPPSAISNLIAVSSTVDSIALQWASPGDDGNSGTASQYDLRYSYSLITDANWATRYQAGGEPTPQIAGSSESMTVNGLLASTTYYFAIKAADEVPNWSGLSNVATKATTAIPDTAPPVRGNGQPTGTLAAGTVQTTISLSTDENANCKYSQAAGTPFAAMANVFATTGALTHSTTVSGFSDGNSYSYYVRCQDSAGNINPDDFEISFSIATALQDLAPTVFLNSPGSGISTYLPAQDFNCSAYDDRRLSSIALYTDTSGTWRADQSRTVSGTATTQVFSLTGLTPGNYKWNCRATDNSSQVSFGATNFTFAVIQPVYSYSVIPSTDSFSSPPNSYVNRSITLNNTGNQALNSFTCTANVSWAAIIGCPSSLAQNSVANVVVQYNAAGLAEGLHGVLLTFTTAQAGLRTSTVTVNVTSNPFNPIPQMGPVTVTPTFNSATIAWSTSGVNSNSSVEYGLNETLLEFRAGQDDNVESHSVTLSSLSPGAIYYFKAGSCSLGGCNYSEVQNFTTLAMPQGCDYGNPPCPSGQSCQSNVCVAPYQPPSSSSSPYSPPSSPDTYASPSPSIKASPTPIPKQTAREIVRGIIEVEDEYSNNLGDLPEQDRLAIENYLKDAKELAETGRTEQALIVLNRARDRLKTTVQKTQDQKASFTWLVSIVLILAVMALSIYYIKKTHKKIEQARAVAPSLDADAKPSTPDGRGPPPTP